VRDLREHLSDQREALGPREALAVAQSIRDVVADDELAAVAERDDRDVEQPAARRDRFVAAERQLVDPWRNVVPLPDPPQRAAAGFSVATRPASTTSRPARIESMTCRSRCESRSSASARS
jgi:hypothetical protein